MLHVVLAPQQCSNLEQEAVAILHLLQQHVGNWHNFSRLNAEGLLSWKH
jgi:hypothetical protein